MEDQVFSRTKTNTIREYYLRLDAGRADIFDLFSEDIQFYFPKYGLGRGKAELQFCSAGLGASLRSLRHNLDSLHFIEGTDGVAVEGLTFGVTASGVEWRGGETPGGRFCSIFEFKGPLISRMHVYLDPDYSGADKERFLWGHEGRRW